MAARAWPIVLLLALALLSPARAAIVAFQDDTLADADWEMTIFYSEGNSGTTTAWQVATGGNPGAFRMVETIVNDAPPYSGIGAFHRYLPAVYDPGTSGAILSIDYSEDSSMFAGGGAGQATGPALRQAGVVYYHHLNGTSFGGWRSYSIAGLTAVDFRDSPYGNQHPDFSATAPPIEVGFYRANSTYSGGYTILAGIDNWRFTIRNDQPTAARSSTWGRIRGLNR